MNEQTSPNQGVIDAYGIDYSRPLYPQIAALGDRYWEWSHQHVTPKFRQQLAVVRGGERWPDSFPIFAQPWLEAQTHLSWRQVLGFWGVVVVALAVAGTAGSSLRGAVAAGLWLAGFLLWTLVEYLLHRLLFHHRPRSAAGRRFHFLAHGIHHKDPWDRTRLVFPLLGGFVIAVGLFTVLALLLPVGPAMLVMSGLLVGYLAYDLGHYAWHHASFQAPLLRYLKRYHLAHHFKDMDSRFGVSQPLWDWIFRSGGLRG